MLLVFLGALINETIGLLPITFIQGSYIIANPSLTLYEHTLHQAYIALAFAIGNFGLYYVGRFGSIPVINFCKKYKLIKENSKPVQANFFWVLLMRSVPFFPAKHVSVGLGALRYNLTLFFISSLVGIFIRGMILVYLFELGIRLHL